MTMPSSINIETIKESSSTQYKIDLTNIATDQQKLNDIITEPAEIDPKLIYTQAVTFSSDQSLALVPDLETFPYSDVSTDPRLYTRRIEQNLDEGVRFVQNCLQMRQYYAELGKLRSDTRFKAEEFFRLDAVHIEEVAAGLYELPWKEASNDSGALQDAVAQTVAQQAVIDEMMQTGSTSKKYSGILSDTSVIEFIGKSAQLARDSSGNNPLEVYKGTTETATYRSNLENATWVQALAAIESSLAQLRGKLSTAQQKADYLRKDIGFRSHRAAISRYLAYLQMAEHCRANSVINYAERLERQRELFKSNLVGLIQRVNALVGGLKDIYGVDIPLNPPARGRILDDLSVWIVNVQEEVAKVKRTHRLSITSMWTNSVITVTPRSSAARLDTFSVDIEVDMSDLPAANSMLRGVAFEFLGQQTKPLVLNVLPPQGAYDAVNRGGNADTLRFGRVGPFSPAADPKPQHADVFWNGAPAGVWRIGGTFDQNAGPLEAIVMHLWVASV
jgi:hypothetical protein